MILTFHKNIGAFMRLVKEEMKRIPGDPQLRQYLVKK